MENIIKLFTVDGPIYVSSAQLNSSKTLLTIYTSRGNKLSDMQRSSNALYKAGCGVHRDNLFASHALAEKAEAEIFASMPMLLQA